MLSRKKVLIYSLFFIFCSLFFAFSVSAQNFKNALPEAAEAAKPAGVSMAAEPEPYIATLINAALSLVGVIFLILMVYGGFVWMTAKGDAQLVEKAKDTITMALIGLAVVVAAYAISKFVISKII